MEVFKLYGSILMDTADAEKSIAKTGEKTEGLAKKFGNGVKTAAKWAAGIGAAAVAVGGAMYKAVESTAKSLDTVDKGSQRMGIAAEKYQELAYAAGLSGVQMTTMEAAAKKLEGTDLNMDDALNSILAIGDESERTQAAIDLFGESIAYKMTPLLAAGAEGMDEMREEANALGLVMSEDTVKAGASMNDTISKVTQSFSTLKNNLAAELMPYIAKVLDWVLENMPMIQSTIKSVIDAVLPIVKSVFDLVMDLLPPVLSAIKDFLDWIMPYLRPVLNSVMGVVKGVMALISGDFNSFAESIKNLLKSLGSALFGIGKDIMRSLWDGIKNIWGNVKGWFDEKVSWIKDKLSFWRASNDEMQTGNAHASGLRYVPYDNYPALLHRGETVLNAADAARYKNGEMGNTTVNLTVNGAQGQDVRELARIIMDEIQSATDRRRAVFS